MALVSGAIRLFYIIIHVCCRYMDKANYYTFCYCIIVCVCVCMCMRAGIDVCYTWHISRIVIILQVRWCVCMCISYTDRNKTVSSFLASL